MAQTPRLTTLWLSTALAAPVAITGISNAKPAVVTAPGHGLSIGDVVMLNTSWGRMQERAFEVSAVSGDTFTVKDSDTTNTDFYPAGGGVGSLQKPTGWTQLTKVTGFTSSGGDPKMVSYYYLESEQDFNINDGFNAVSYSVTLDADAIGTAGYTLARDLTENGQKTIFRMRFKNGGRLYMPVDVAISETPSINDGQIMTVPVALNGKNRPVRYAGA